MTDSADRRWLTIAEVAAQFDGDARTVGRWIQRGDLIPFRHGRVVRIALDELERFLKRHCR